MNDLKTMAGWNTNFHGQILQGHYRIEEQVGQGGMSWLYRVTHTKLDESLVLKLMFPQYINDPLARSRFLDEAKIQFKLKHPHIIQVTDVIEEENLIGIVQEWIDGEDLKSYIIRCPDLLTPGELRTLFEPLLGALHFAHKMKIVHRDVKPSNVLLYQEEPGIWRPKLGDFGVAKLMDGMGERTSTGMTLGTFKYIAPEQIVDSKDVDIRADIYSFGVMLFELATGNLPFQGSAHQVMYKHLHEHPPDPSELNPDIPEELAMLILRCLEKNPEHRYPDCEALKADFLKAIPEAQELRFEPTPHSAILPEDGSSYSMMKGGAFFNMSSLDPKAREELERRRAASAQARSGKTPSRGDHSGSWGSSQNHSKMRLGPASERSLASDEEVARLTQQLFQKVPKEGLDDTGQRISNSFYTRGRGDDDSLSGFSGAEDNFVTTGVKSYSFPENPPAPEQGSKKKSALWIVVGLLLLIVVGGFGWWSGQRSANTKSSEGRLALHNQQDTTNQKSQPQETKEQGIRPSNKRQEKRPGKTRPEPLAPTPPRPRLPSPLGPEKPRLPTPALPSVEKCKEGERRSCYTGPSSTQSVGPCKAGRQRCRKGKWTRCQGQILPRRELCNGRDDNCDGKIDETFGRRGSACTVQRGVCRMVGKWRCSSNKRALQCIPQKTSGGYVSFRIRPAQVTFTLRENGRIRKVRGRACLRIQQKTRFALSASGYQMCLFQLPARNRKLTVRMNRKSELEETPSYCLR